MYYFGLAGVDLLDLDSPSVAATTTATNGVNGVDKYGIESHQITDGIISFSTDDSTAFSSTGTLSNASGIAAAIAYLIANDIGDAGSTVAFTDGADTYVYQQTGSGTGAHVLVELVGKVADSIVSAGGSTGDLLIG